MLVVMGLRLLEEVLLVFLVLGAELFVADSVSFSELVDLGGVFGLELFKKLVEELSVSSSSLGEFLVVHTVFGKPLLLPFLLGG